VVLLAVLLAGLASPGPLARAQALGAEADAEALRARARERFLEGTTAMDEARWADAVEAFREAHDLVGSPVALYNLGFALRALGRYREALDAFDVLLATEGLDEATRTDAASLRDEVRGRVATLAVEGLPPETVTLVLDALDLVDTGLRPLELTCDPGRHVLRIEAEGRTGFEWRGEVGAGERRSLEATLSPLVEEPLEEPRSLVDEPAFWVILGVALVGAGVAAGVGGWAADEAAQLRPEATRLRL
jgi:tetratricopeptide (TPR) repeat protein